MRDIPVFATENGVASLALKEIPYYQTAYIQIQDTREPQKLLEECVGFCKAAGAESVYAAGHPYLEKYPFHTAIWQLSNIREALADTDAALFPVTEQTLEAWRELYNRRMADVPNASYMTKQDGTELLKKGNGYFVHRGDVLLGIGIASGEQIDAVVAAESGAGEQVMQALNHALSGERILLQVASENKRAVRLYERLGFITVKELSVWYCVG